jgi:hypothetical protein
MSSLVGNAAAHRALESADPFSLQEAVLYEAQAEDEADMRRWNKEEIQFFRERAARYAGNLIRKRTRSHRGRSVEALVASAGDEINRFINEVIQKK